MKSRPILFSGPMVRAILEDRKTQTRRLIKSLDRDGHFVEVRGKMFDTRRGSHAVAMLSLCPYGLAGDRLWVRETLKLRDPGQRSEAWTYGADGAVIELPNGDARVPAMLSWAHHKEGNTCVSIHMPRWACRLELDVTAVRAERLQDISEEEARAEGCPAYPCRASYAALWDSINGGNRAAWSSNPWVFVVTFQRAT